MGYLDLTVIMQRCSHCVEARRLVHDQGINLLWLGQTNKMAALGCTRLLCIMS
jgi:3-deoxy-D-manno-octulosonate 8-phosphate phosphatase KdsC-like HAD superfamily phosphatase